MKHEYIRNLHGGGRIYKTLTSDGVETGHIGIEWTIEQSLAYYRSVETRSFRVTRPSEAERLARCRELVPELARRMRDFAGILSTMHAEGGNLILEGRGAWRPDRAAVGELFFWVWGCIARAEFEDPDCNAERVEENPLLVINGPIPKSGTEPLVGTPGHDPPRVIRLVQQRMEWWRQLGEEEKAAEDARLLADLEQADPILPVMVSVWEIVDVFKDDPDRVEIAADVPDRLQQAADELERRLEEWVKSGEQPESKTNPAGNGDGNVKRPKLPTLGPHDRKAYQSSLMHGMTQQKVADALNREYGTNYTQGQVSRMIKRAKDHAEASGLSELADAVIPKAKREIAVDPSRLGLGARTDHAGHNTRTKARNRADSED